MKKSKLNKFLSYYKFGIILFLLILITSVGYNNYKVKPLFEVDIILIKNNNFMYGQKLDNDKLIQVKLYYEEAKISFNNSVLFKKNFDENLIELNKFCKEYKINFIDNKYHKIKCVTENPKFIEFDIANILNDTWKKLHKEQPLKTFSSLGNEQIDRINFIEIIEKKYSPKKNVLKNILKFNLIVLFLIIVYYQRKKIFKFF